jgi:sortase A
MTAPLATGSTVVADPLIWPCQGLPVPSLAVDLSTVLRGVGKTFICAGMLVLLFVAYQLWGTGIAEARAQHELRKQLQAVVQLPPASTTTTAPHSPTTTADPLPPPPVGGALAIIRIPSIHVNVAAVEGVGVEDLKKGPGHYPASPLPGQPGNTAFAGHRTTYGAPFYRLDGVKAGDPIFISTRYGTFHYTVLTLQDVSPSDVSVIAPTQDNRLTLTTCTPRFSASKRLIVVSRLDGPATAPPTRAVHHAPAQPATTPDSPTIAAVGSLSGQGTTTVPAVLWACVCAAIWIGAYWIGRKWRRWPAYLVATPFFLLALFIFFENFARFVPANI